MKKNGNSPKKEEINIKYRRRYGISFSYKKLLEDGPFKLKNEEIIKYTSKKEDSPKKSDKSICKKKILRTNLFFESEKNELNKLYGEDEKIKYQIVPILNFLKITDCSMMKYGARKSSIEIDYSYCKTCDNNSLKPICLPCINKCHFGHVIKFILKKGHIKCSCGEKNHMIMKINYNKISNVNCLCNEWNSTANLKFYYINKNKEPICILCNYSCQDDNHKSNIIKLKKNKSMPNCACRNKDIHNDKRIICEKLLNLISASSDFDNFLHPIQFVNMLFKSKNNFKFVFEYFDFFISDLNNSKDYTHIIDFLSKMRRIDVEYTNIYKTLLILEKIIEKTEKNNIYFFHKEVLKYFSFDIIKKTIEVLIKSSIEEKLFWQLTNKFLYLFQKIYINEKTKSLNKFKLTDLKHLNYFYRISLVKENNKKFSESSEIISFLFSILNHVNNHHPSNIEAIHCLKEIISVFRKFSCFNLIKNHDMVKFCSCVLESFNWIREIKNFNLKNGQNDIKSKIDFYYFNNISIKLFYIIMKTLQNFIFNYNDNIINSIISNKKKYPNINDIKPENICFIFKKNELGELIYKISINILSTLERDYKKTHNKRIILTQRLSEQIIHYSLIEDDNYILNIIDSVYKYNINYNISLEKNKFHSEYLKQANNISNIFNQYFNFEKSIEESLELISDSLNFFLEDKKIKNISSFKEEKYFQEFSPEQQLAIYYTNYYCLISKTIDLIQNHEKRIKESEKNENSENYNDLIKPIQINLEDDIIKKILLFYFSFSKNSAENSFLILSHYIIKELLKLPIKYCHILFILFHRCIKNIFNSEFNTIKIDSSFLLKRFFNYLNELMSFQDEKDNIVLFCVDEFLQILELATLNYEYSLFNGFVYKIQYLIIMIDKNFKLVKKYFEIENKESILHKNNGTNILSKIFATYMKLINVCFDFSVEDDRKKIKEIIDINEILYAIENYKLTLELKTEFLRYVRKYMIDLKYSHQEKNLYITAIKDNKDNLEEIKDNSLLNYYNYPTKFLSFLKDLYNITSITYFKEKIEEKSNESKENHIKRNSNIRNWVIENKGNKDINLSNEISDLGETKLDHSWFFEEYKNNVPIFNYLDKHIHNLEGSYNRTPKRGSQVSTIIPQTSNLKQSKIDNRLSMVIPHEKKRIMNIYISSYINDDDIEERELDKKDLKIFKDILKENNNELLYNKIKEMNLFEDAFNNRFYNIINKELEETLGKDWKLNGETKINLFKNYIENGILIPIIFYFKKVMIMINLFNGNEMIKLFSLLKKCLKLKLFLYKNNNIWKQAKDLEEKEDNSILLEHFNIFKFHNNINISIIDHTKFFSQENIDITKESLDIINSNKISIYDYSIFFEIIEKELFPLIKEKKPIIFNSKFNYKFKNDFKELENLFKIKKSFIKSEEHKKLIKSMIIYKYTKSNCDNENNSSILSILSELNLEYEINFRNILLSIIIKISKEINLKNEFVVIHYYILLILLDLQTEETQGEIMNLIGKNENKNFLKDCSEILHTKIILSIIDCLNPTDGLMNYNYFISYNILCIFKFLCLKNNKFFKMNFIRGISYNYISNIFCFFKINPVIQNHAILEETMFGSGNFDGNTINEKDKSMIYKNLEENVEHVKINKIKFYDFFLILIPKICLISNWDKSQKIEQNNYLYELFSSIIDFLAEIINENKSEMLSIIFDEIILIKEGAHLEKIKNIESFDDFMKNISSIILDKKNNNELNNKVKKKLIDYINSIIDEKETDEIIEKCIEKHLNINKIYKNISNLMKLYFIRNMQFNDLNKDKEQEKSEKKENDKELKNIKKEQKLKKKEEKKKKKKLKKKKNEINESNLEKNLTYNIRDTHLNEQTNKIENEENSTSKNKMLSLIMDVNHDIKKHLFALNTIDSIKNEENDTIIKETKIEKNNSNIKISKITFGKYLYKYFKREFHGNSQFIESLDFKLCGSYYKYIKFTKLKKEELENNEIENIIEMYYKEKEKQNKKHYIEDIYYFNYNSSEHITQLEKDYIEKYFIEKFFEKILSKIEVIKQNKENKIILFTRYPLIKFLSKETKLEFWENVNRDSEVSKKYDLIKYIDYFLEEINYNKNNETKFIFLTKINFHFLLILSYTLSAFLNLFFLFTMKGDNQITEEETLMKRIKGKKDINDLINKSSNEWDKIYKLLCFFYMILNAIFIIIWMVQQLPLYYTVNKIDFIKKENGKNKIKIFGKIVIFFQILKNKGDNILPLIYEFIVCLLCILLKQGKMMYPFLLIPILYINKTLRNIILSIKMNIHSFTLAFSFAFIIMYLFSNLYFFFYNYDFEKEINYYEDNYCKTLTFAFLNALDSGLRARGGLGDSAKRISFSTNKSHYILRLILDDIFFFLIVIIMIDLVFGIVLRSFDKLQHINYKYQIDKTHHCFICNSKKENLEKIRINFNEHINITHNVWDYIEFLIKIKLKDETDVNPMNSYIFNKINKKDISFLPTYKYYENEISQENNFSEDKNISILSENFPNYKIK